MSGLIDRCDEKAPEYRDISRFLGIRIGQKWREDETKKLKLFCDKSLVPQSLPIGPFVFPEFFIENDWDKLLLFGCPDS